MPAGRGFLQLVPGTAAMRSHLPFKPVAAALMCCILGACNLVAGEPAHDLLWQAEVEAASLPRHAAAAAGGDAEAFDALRRSRDAVEAALAAAAAKSPPPANLAGAWSETRELADLIQSHRDAVLQALDIEADFRAAMPPLLVRIDEITRSVTDSDPPGTTLQVYLLGRVQLLLTRMERGAGQLRAGGSDAISAADRFARDARMVDQTLSGLLEGNPELGIEAIAAPEARAALGDVPPAIAQARRTAEPLLAAAPALLEARDAADGLPAAVEDLRATLQQARLRR